MLRNLVISSSVIVLLLASAEANAQQPAPNPPPPPPTLEPPPYTGPGQPLARPPEEEAQKNRETEAEKEKEKTEGPKLPPLRFYGTIKPTVAVSGRAVESFSNPNASAITAAGNPVTSPLHRTGRLSFQMAQSRFGFWVNEKGHLRGHVEIDFFDSAKATPTVASVPRLRIATVDWVPCEGFSMSFGQDWDLHAPLNPYTINLVGALFEAGNVGFMRQQIKAFIKSKAFELGAAVGIQGQNLTAKDNNIEIAHFPSFAVRAAALVGKTGKIGVSGIATQFTFAQGTPTERQAGGLSGAAFADVTPYEALNIRFEGYISRNLANMGSLALGQGGAGLDADEIGGFVSGRHEIVEGHGIYATAGFAQILNPSDIRPAYQYPAAAPGTIGATAPDAANAVTSGAGPGMRWNWSARLGYEYRPIKAVAFVLEGFVYQSRHVLVALDNARFNATQLAPGIEAGILYTF